jgi:hypothetical protein
MACLQKRRADHRSSLRTTSQSPSSVECRRVRSQADRASPVPTAKLSRPLRPPRLGPLARSARLDRCRRTVRLCPLPRQVCLRQLRPLLRRAHQVRACRQPQLLRPHAPAGPRAGTTRSPGRGRPSPGPGTLGHRVLPSPRWQVSRPAAQPLPTRPSLSRHQPPLRRKRRPGPPGLPSPSRRQLPPCRNHTLGRRGPPSRPARSERWKRCCRRRQPGRFPRRPQTPRVRDAVGERPVSSPARRYPQASPPVQGNPQASPPVRGHPQVSPAVRGHPRASPQVRERPAVSPAVRPGRRVRPGGADWDPSSASPQP